MKLRRFNEWMFQIVKCSGYLRKAMDGRFIRHYRSDETPDNKEKWCYWWIENGEARERKIPDEDLGGSDFIKTYYEKEDREFVGVVVGFEMVTVKAQLYLDFHCDDYSETYFVNKDPVEQVKCARVFYGCNRSRLVPMEDMVVMKEAGND